MGDAMKKLPGGTVIGRWKIHIKNCSRDKCQRGTHSLSVLSSPHKPKHKESKLEYGTKD